MNTPKAKRSLGQLPLVYPQPALLVGTYDQNGKANMMLAAWGGICSSDPLSVMVAIRPQRWTYEALLARKAFTVCIPPEKLAVQADFLGLASGRKYDKLALAGLTALKAEKVDAPYLDECPVALECALTQSVEVGAHTMMIGSILDVKVDESCLVRDENGKFKPDIHKIAPLIYDSGSNAYYGIGARLGDAFSIGKKYMK